MSDSSSSSKSNSQSVPAGCETYASQIQKKLQDKNHELKKSQKEVKDQKEKYETVNAKFASFQKFSLNQKNAQERQIKDLTDRHNRERSELLNQLAARGKTPKIAEPEVRNLERVLAARQAAGAPGQQVAAAQSQAAQVAAAQEAALKNQAPRAPAGLPSVPQAVIPGATIALPERGGKAVQYKLTEQQLALKRQNDEMRNFLRQKYGLSDSDSDTGT